MIQYHKGINILIYPYLLNTMKPSNVRQNRRRLTDIQHLVRSSYYIATDEDGSSFTCLLTGPKDTPYDGRKWRVRMQLPSEYPFRSPSVGFVDHIFHPNIDHNSGTICLNALNQEWTPVYNLVSIFETLLPQLLTYPNPDDPLNSQAASLLRDNLPAYETRCKACIGWIPQNEPH